MKIFECIATVLAYSSLGVFIVYMLTSLVLAVNTVGLGRFYKKFNDFYKNICIFFCLPSYGFSFVSEGIAEKIGNRNPILSFILATVLFLIVLILLKQKKN